ncbi:hypothetical protein [Enterococcus wangshanyuanii]|uniref:Uncharacterized protein n=1 Tax=Enterococcus wangshanyuanii TaxID=2005703 RepID=A0ABQ1PT27_9ENTE|nr:hypothetical protein [Enterococcus wangshanyuanii]GGD03306.1 hypothetical protein GCM10011573_35960 [Enterococcus wangshanyuanii]
MGTSIFKEQARHLALKESDVDFVYQRSNQQKILKQLTINANKVIELRENNLLELKQWQEYSAILLVHNRKTIKIPITKGSWRYCGKNKARLRFSIPNNVRLSRSKMQNWHLR